MIKNVRRLLFPVALVSILAASEPAHADGGGGGVYFNYNEPASSYSVEIAKSQVIEEIRSLRKGMYTFGAALFTAGAAIGYLTGRRRTAK